MLRKKRGLISYRNKNGKQVPYEINITWYSALKENNEDLSIKKYLCSRAIELALEGIPGIYIQGLLGIENDLDKVSKTEIKRDINRSKLNIARIKEVLEDNNSKNCKLFTQFTNLIKIRSKQKPFHPAARQKILFLNDYVFSFLRTSGKEKILALHNVSNEEQKIDVKRFNIKEAVDLISKKGVSNIITLEPYQFMWVKFDLWG